jgi:hypothetical protein
LFDDGGAGNGLALVAHQEFKQRKFLRAKIDAVTAATYGMTCFCSTR